MSIMLRSDLLKNCSNVVSAGVTVSSFSVIVLSSACRVTCVLRRLLQAYNSATFLV